MLQRTAHIDIDNNAAVINALRAKDEMMFDMVYRHYHRGLCAFASQYVPLNEAEEIVQETMLWLWENRDSLNPSLSLKSLLFMIVKNRALNHITHEDVRHRVHQAISEKYREEFESPDFYLNTELIRLYRDALAKLPPEFRTAFEMNRNQQLTHKEIAVRLNVSPQTVNYRISQALKILRTELKDYLPLLLFMSGWR